jgi:DNA-binding NtrC family response regulator
MTVLVVDDELLIRWSIAETLERCGHVVVQGEDASTALKRLRESSNHFDVVLLDYRLPDSHDLQLLAAVRQLSPQSAVVLMSAYMTPEVMNGALDLGAYRVISKPIDVHEIEGLLIEASKSRVSH